MPSYLRPKAMVWFGSRVTNHFLPFKTKTIFTLLYTTKIKMTYKSIITSKITAGIGGCSRELPDYSSGVIDVHRNDH